jgi:hypothetical protein
MECCEGDGVSVMALPDFNTKVIFLKDYTRPLWSKY